MSWYKEYRDEWKEVIQTVARDKSRNNEMVEKDVIQSMFLHELSASSLPFVFKGGTSLSKAYGLIDRFSEDIDLSMNRKITESEKRLTKNTITEISEALGLVLSNPNDVQSRHSYNKYVFEYESLFSNHPLEMIVETSFYQSVYPAEKHNIDSFVGAFCREHDIEMPIPFKAANVTMNVQTLERTFIDKVFAVCDYRLQNMQDRDSRHLYDIAKLLPTVSFSPELEMLITDVRKDRMNSKNNPSAQPQYNISELLNEIISSEFFKSDYNSITRKLLYEDMSYEYAIENGIAIVAKKQIF